MKAVYRLALGGTAVGTGINAARGFAEATAAKLENIPDAVYNATPQGADIGLAACPPRHDAVVSSESHPMREELAVVYIIDDDEAVREGVADLLRSIGYSVQSFGSAQEFLDSRRPDAPGCIVLDVRLPGPSGLEFQRTLAGTNIQLPIIFISGHGDIPMSVSAIKSGAIEFLTKPVHEQQLLDAVQAGLERDRARRQEAKVAADLQERFDSLTPREREIFLLVVSGRRNKQIAGQLGVSEMTVKVHRSQITRKMRTNSVVDLVRMADQLGLSTKTD